MEAVSGVTEVVVAGMFEVEVVFVVFNFLKADFPNEREDFLVLLVSGSSSSGSLWCFCLDLFLTLPVFCFFISVFLSAVEAATDEVDNLLPF